jgi:putative N-acetylmannosamine-6-phosphate epimerase
VTDIEVVLADISGGLVVSCQPEAGGPLDRDDIVTALAAAVVQAGARALRIEGVERVRKVRAVVDVPVIGIVKRNLDAWPIRITPFIGDVLSLIDAGADIVAIDATDRKRPVPVADLVQYALSLDAIVMADCATAAEAVAANRFGCHIVATTLSGYTGDAVPAEPDLDLVRTLSGKGLRVMAEGRIRKPEDAQAALQAGAWAVTVGSAITRPEHVTQWFVAALSSNPSSIPAAT